MLREKEKDKTLPFYSLDLSSHNPVINREMLEIYYHYLTERHSIYKKKEAGLPKPWTDDPIMQTNSFTNDKRWLDKTSKWLINNITNNNNLSYSEKVWRSIIFRLYNKIETAELIDLSSKNFWLNIDDVCNKIDGLDCDPFSRAYKIIGIKYAYRDDSPYGHDRWKSSLLFHVALLRKQYKGMVPNEVEDTPESCLEWLNKNIKGCGSFIGYQIFVDFTYIPEYPYTDNFFTIAGPGCRAGIDMLCENRDGLSYEEFLEWLKHNIDRLFKSVDPEYDVHKLFDNLDEEDQYWNLEDLENSFCETSKLVYLMNNRHKRPRHYDGV